MSAVSTKLMPLSRALPMMRTQSSWSVFPHAPNIIEPRAYSLTEMPVVPNVIRFMFKPFECSEVGPGRHPGSRDEDTHIWSSSGRRSSSPPGGDSQLRRHVGEVVGGEARARRHDSVDAVEQVVRQYDLGRSELALEL